MAVKKNKSKPKQEKYSKRAKRVIALFVFSVPIVFFQYYFLVSTSGFKITKHSLCDQRNGEPEIRNIPVTAYSSTYDQTDSSPFITANGTKVHWGVVATNLLPFYTCIRFPEEFGQQFFVVHDRKHERFSESIDIWFPTREAAKTFGKKILKTEIW